MDLAFKSFNDELDVLCWNALDGLLDDVVAVLIFDTLQNVVLKLFHKLSLLVS
jgi:hypothetical protein